MISALRVPFQVHFYAYAREAAGEQKWGNKLLGLKFLPHRSQSQSHEITLLDKSINRSISSSWVSTPIIKIAAPTTHRDNLQRACAPCKESPVNSNQLKSTEKVRNLEERRDSSLSLTSHQQQFGFDWLANSPSRATLLHVHCRAEGHTNRHLSKETYRASADLSENPGPIWPRPRWPPECGRLNLFRSGILYKNFNSK